MRWHSSPCGCCGLNVPPAAPIFPLPRKRTARTADIKQTPKNKKINLKRKKVGRGSAFLVQKGCRLRLLFLLWANGNARYILVPSVSSAACPRRLCHICIFGIIYYHIIHSRQETECIPTHPHSDSQNMVIRHWMKCTYARSFQLRGAGCSVCGPELLPLFKINDRVMKFVHPPIAMNH